MNLLSKTSDKVKEQIINYQKQYSSKKRFKHILRVEAISHLLVLKYYPAYCNQNSFFTSMNDALYTFEYASLIHDLTKEWKAERHRQFLLELINNNSQIYLKSKEKINFSVSDLQEYLSNDDALLHSFTACLFAAQKFSFWNEKVYSLVCQHTMPKTTIDPWILLFFSADYLASNYLYKKFGEDYLAEVNRKIKTESIYTIAMEKIKGNISSLYRQRNKAALDMLALYRVMENEKFKNSQGELNGL